MFAAVQNKRWIRESVIWRNLIKLTISIFTVAVNRILFVEMNSLLKRGKCIFRDAFCLHEKTHFLVEQNYHQHTFCYPWRAKLKETRKNSTWEVTHCRIAKKQVTYTRIIWICKKEKKIIPNNTNKNPGMFCNSKICVRFISARFAYICLRRTQQIIWILSVH